MVEGPYFIQTPNGGFAPAPSVSGFAPAPHLDKDCALCVSRLAVVEERMNAAVEWRQKHDKKMDELNEKLDLLLDHKQDIETTVRLGKWIAGGIGALAAFIVSQLNFIPKLFGKG